MTAAYESRARGGFPLNSRIVLAAALAAAALAPASLADPIYFAPYTTRTLVEGHTVFAMVEKLDGPATGPSAVLGLLEARTITTTTGLPLSTSGGVRWTNDQYIVGGPHATGAALAVLAREVSPDGTATRTPCSGAVLAVNSGSPDPRSAFPNGLAGPDVFYVESYLVTDANDHEWNTDVWLWYDPYSGFETKIWSVAVLGVESGYSTPDDGVNDCAPYTDHSFAATTGDNGMAYPDGGSHPLGGHFQYNALLYFFLEDLTVAGADRAHDAASRAGVPSICEACDEQGNSHSFDRWTKLGFHTRPDGGTDAAGSDWGHATRLVDVYVWGAELPAVRNLRVIDTEGSAQAFPR